MTSDDHGRAVRPPESMPSAHADSRVRSILELWRMSVGSSGTTSTAASGRSVALRTAAVTSGPARRRAPGGRGRLDDGDRLTQPVRPDADDRGAAHGRHASRSAARARPVRRGRPSSSARAAGGPRPTAARRRRDGRRRRCGASGPPRARWAPAAAVGQPQPVVGRLEVRGGDDDLAEHPAPPAGRTAGAAVVVERRDQHACCPRSGVRRRRRGPRHPTPPRMPASVMSVTSRHSVMP